MWSLAFAEAWCGVLSTQLTALAEQLTTPTRASAAAVVVLRLLMVFALFPLTILALVILEGRGLLGWTAWLAPLGDISYPVYLLHFPLQCAVILIARVVDVEPGYANTTLFMAGFFAILFCLAALSTYQFEKPAQEYMRRRFGRMGKRKF